MSARGIEFTWPIREIVRQHHERQSDHGACYDADAADACVTLFREHGHRLPD